MKKENFIWSSIKVGLIAGAIGIFLCLVGMVEVFSKRDVIEKVVTLGIFLLLTISIGAGFIASRRTSDLLDGNKAVSNLLAGTLAGLFTGIVLALFVLFSSQVNLRAVFLNVTPALLQLLTFNQGTGGVWQLPVFGALAGLAGGAFLLLSPSIRKPIVTAIMVIIFMALFSTLFRVIMINQGDGIERAAKFLFGQTGLTINGGLIFFFGTMLISIVRSSQTGKVQGLVDKLSPKGKISLRVASMILLAYVVIMLPQAAGPFIAQVVVIISLYILMGLGLNIEIGFAGLLDLGFVAFYAIGAYTVGLLTSYGEFGLQHISFWVAVPIAVLVAMLFGGILGVPVLGVRGDYLAIATLGFGEIVRLLAGSDFMARWLGGPRGIIGIQKPCIGTLGEFVSVDVPRICNGIELGKPQDIYYVAIASALLIAFFSYRLRESRLGRAWMAIREDEDVAEALGIKLVQAKLLAYMLGAAFAGLGGAIFATLVGSIFASSMQLIVSINVVALIIVGGMGSIPGVVIGAIALIGLPELLREVSEFRYLLYGAALVIVMLAKPEGLWPSQTIVRELHQEDVIPVPSETNS
jgi:branched-chain amino acid transport system permease protein